MTGRLVIDGRRADRLHRLNRDGCLEREARKDHEEAEGDEDAGRIHFGDGEIADEEGSQRPEVPEGPGRLVQCVVVPANPHGGDEYMLLVA